MSAARNPQPATRNLPPDYFALLGESRRPWLDEERVKETFHRLSRERHPDQVTAVGDFAELNAAQAALRDPKTRLRHLLALEYPHVAVSGPASVPAALSELLFPIHGLLQKIDAFLARQDAASGALARALLAGEQFALREEAETRLGELEALHATLLAELQTFDAARWDARPPDAETTLLGFYHGFAYLSRWLEQFRERLFRLSV